MDIILLIYIKLIKNLQRSTCLPLQDTYHITAEISKPVCFVTQAGDMLQAFCTRYSVFHYGTANRCGEDGETQHDTECYPTLTNIFHSRIQNTMVWWKYSAKKPIIFKSNSTKTTLHIRTLILFAKITFLHCQHLIKEQAQDNVLSYKTIHESQNTACV